MDKDFKHIAVAGNIGAGKTTLTKLLSRHYGWIPHYEQIENNPYIDDFYEDMQRWSFHMQIYYLNARFQHILNIRHGENTVIQDRTIEEDATIFAPNLHDMGLMTKRDYENYLSLYHTIQQLISPPDLLIYLRGSIPALVNQIQKRGRSFEENLRLDYLKKLNQRYEEWIEQYTGKRLIIVNIDELDFSEKPEDLGHIIQLIERERAGLFQEQTKNS
jgi:deoxyadenosine/deoxycytidine kinase